MDNADSVAHSILSRIALWAADPTLQFPETAVHQARLCFIDTLACMASGAHQTATRNVSDAMVKASSGGGCQTIINTVSLSAPAAALVNGTAAHALDFDDYEIPASTHPSAPIISAIFAVNDLNPQPLGRLLDAYLVGYEVIVRIGQALGGYEHYLAGWHATSTVGSFGATAAAAKLLELSPGATTMSLGLTCSMAAGLKAQFGTDTKPLHAGFAARTGVEATLLASAGITSNPDAMEADYGFLSRYGGENIVKGIEIGTGDCAMDVFPVLRKPWPSCAYTHRAIEAALKHTNKTGFDVTMIDSGRISIPEPYFRVSPFLSPQTPPEARFSILYCAATSLLHGTLSPASFEPNAIQNTQVRNLMSRLKIDAYDVPSSLDDMSPDFPDSVHLTFNDHSTHVESIAHVKGGAHSPLSDADICEKYSQCGGDSGLMDTLLNGAPDEIFGYRLGVVED